MNTNKYMKSFTFVLVAFLLISCSQKEEEKKPEPLTPTYRTVERLHPNCKDQNQDNGCLELSYTYPSFSGGDDIPVKDTLEKAIATFIFDSAGHPLSEASFDELARNWFSFYDSTLTAIPDYKLPWEQRMNVRLIHQTPEYLSVEFAEWEFTGGAHGTETKVYRMYSIPDGKRLTLADILKEDKRNQLAAVAEPVFRDQKKFPDDVKYDERNYFFRDGQFSLNKNYALTEKGLLFHFNPYEIAPYSEGFTRLLLTYGQIDSLLAASYKPSSDVN